MADYNAHMPSESDCAYAAGIIDGEGSISAYRQKSKSGVFLYYLKVTMRMQDADIPMWMAATFGGKYREEPPKKNKQSTAVHSWQIDCKKASSFLQSISPFLRVKKNRAILAIELADLTEQGKKGRPHTHKKGGGLLPYTEAEMERRKELAFAIRKENCKTNASARATSKWGVN